MPRAASSPTRSGGRAQRSKGTSSPRNRFPTSESHTATASARPSRAAPGPCWAAGAGGVAPSGSVIPAPGGTESEPPHVLYAGRLSKEKGVLELVQATRGLPLVVVGDGPLRKRVPQARGFVPRDELERLYAEAAVVACPSRREGFGVTCLEAMAYGKPVVAGDVGGLRDLVVDGETGLLVPPRDPAALRAALGSLLGDRDRRLRLGAAARERARKHFSWGPIVSATLAAYGEASETMAA